MRIAPCQLQMEYQMKIRYWHDPEIQHRNYAALNQTLVTFGFGPNVAYQPNSVTGDSTAAATQLPDDHNCQGRYK
jgi:hypothetical protein